MSLNFKKFVASSFLAINKENPIVIDFSEYHPKGQRITKSSGDQGQRKTSFLNSLLALCAYNFGFDEDNFINAKDGTKSASLEVEREGKQYRIKLTKSKFIVEQLYKSVDGTKQKWVEEEEPKTLARKVIGTIGTSPMYLKNKKGQEQVTELYKMLNVDETLRMKEVELKTALAKAVESRATANRQYDTLKKTLSEEPLYLNWEASERDYAEEKNTETAREKLNEISKNRSAIHANRNNVSVLESNIQRNKTEIEELEKRIQLLRDHVAYETEKVNKSKEFLEENKGVDGEYDAALKEVTTINQYVINRNRWQEIQRKKKEMDEFETFIQQYDIRKDQLRNDLKNLVTDILPPVEGLEVVTEDPIDGRGQGVYYKGFTLAQLSESELWELYLQICLSQDIKCVFIENIQDLGTEAINTINYLAKRGVNIFATEMRRKELNRITFHAEIE